MEKYLKALKGISLGEWRKVEKIMNVNFDAAREEMENNFHLKEIDPNQKDKSLCNLGR
ncbi:hypothetical protein [[Clostridium] polysaccharolyticum]|uniref:Uncharacterized protein n=1 Tax=[Clostridium] polysaccharolyticum TaxID=29364 RepID=A0A1H9YK41_9FIRM|nr:hypothetical protein [[Clostridium] polysaccharolyticum]SES69464.1 hypothetical protein SAMN04487772_10265 [[Clostridium] polysaccharolyticum]